MSFKNFVKEECILAKILYRVSNSFDFSKDTSHNNNNKNVYYHDMVIFQKFYISAEAAARAVLHKKLF